jgi:hypothetical protein
MSEQSGQWIHMVGIAGAGMSGIANSRVVIKRMKSGGPFLKRNLCPSSNLETFLTKSV